MKKRILLAIVVSVCIVVSYAQNDGEKNVQTVQGTEMQVKKVNVSFEVGNATLSVENEENVDALVKILEKNKNLGLQIGMPWCKDNYNMKLIERRSQTITDYFVAKGIEKGRISLSISTIEADKGDKVCDKVSFKIVKIEDEDIVKTENVLSKTKITFAKNTDIPEIEDDNDNINKTVTLLKANPQLKIVVEAYTCGRGSEQHKRDLAQRRANNVRKLFIDKGMNPDQIETAYYTANDLENSQNDKKAKECNCAVFRIVKR